MWERSKTPEMLLFSEFPAFYRNKMIDEVFSRSGGVGTHCSTPVLHLNLKMAVGRKKRTKTWNYSSFLPGSGCNDNGLQGREGETHKSAKWEWEHKDKYKLKKIKIKKPERKAQSGEAERWHHCGSNTRLSKWVFLAAYLDAGKV